MTGQPSLKVQQTIPLRIIQVRKALNVAGRRDPNHKKAAVSIGIRKCRDRFFSLRDDLRELARREMPREVWPSCLFPVEVLVFEIDIPRGCNQVPIRTRILIDFNGFRHIQFRLRKR